MKCSGCLLVLDELIIIYIIYNWIIIDPFRNPRYLKSSSPQLSGLQAVANSEEELEQQLQMEAWCAASDVLGQLYSIRFRSRIWIWFDQLPKSPKETTKWNSMMAVVLRFLGLILWIFTPLFALGIKSLHAETLWQGRAGWRRMPGLRLFGGAAHFSPLDPTSKLPVTVFAAVVLSIGRSWEIFLFWSWLV